MAKDIQSVNDELYTDLSIEDLEKRLEMQMIDAVDVDADDYGCVCDDKSPCRNFCFY